MRQQGSGEFAQSPARYKFCFEFFGSRIYRFQKISACYIFLISGFYFGMCNAGSVFKPGYFAVATQMAELLIISALRTFITSQTEFPTGVLKALSDRYLHKALQVIHDQYHQSLSVELLARTASMSRSNFMAQFKKQVGVPPMVYLNRLRINQAQTLLNKTQLPVSQIADQVGFHSDRAFRQAFKGQTGLAPREYRDQAQALSP